MIISGRYYDDYHDFFFPGRYYDPTEIYKKKINDAVFLLRKIGQETFHNINLIEVIF